VPSRCTFVRSRTPRRKILKRPSFKRNGFEQAPAALPPAAQTGSLVFTTAYHGMGQRRSFACVLEQSLSQCLVEIGNQVVDGFQTDAQADHLVASASSHPLLVCQLPVRSAGWVKN